MLNYSWDNTLPCSVYVYIGGKEFTDDEVESFEINESIIADNKISIGNICNHTINLKLANVSPDGTDNTDVLNNQLINQSFLVYIKSGSGASTNDIPLGTFTTTSVTVETITTTIQGEGRFANPRFTAEYVSGLDWGYPHYILDLVDDIDAVDNIDTSMLAPDFQLPEGSDIAFEGLTKKEMLGAIASVYAANVYLDRTGKPQFKLLPTAIDNPDITLTADDLFDFNTNYNMTQVSSVHISWSELEYDQQQQETVVNKGEADYNLQNPSDLYNNIQMEVDLPFVIPQRVNPIANSLLAYQYTAFQADVVANPNYEIGDKIQITDYKNNTYTGIIFSIQHSYNGNYSQTITCNTDNTTVQNKKKTGTISGGTGGVDESEAEQIAQDTAQQVVNNTVNSSTTAETVNAFNLDSVFESVITNIKPCLLKYDETNEVYIYVNTPPTNYIRNYIKLEKNSLQFIESHFAESSTYSAANTELFTLGGSQVYYTSITGADAFKFLTFTSPSVLHPDDNAELYKVRLPKATNTYVKSEYRWTYDQTLDTYNVQLVFGTGDNQGRGKGYFEKTNDGYEFKYTSRTTGQDIGFAIKDDAVYDILNGVQYKHRIQPVYDDLTQVPQDFPDDNFLFIKATT